jgi:hypothetical protein
VEARAEVAQEGDERTCAREADGVLERPLRGPAAGGSGERRRGAYSLAMKAVMADCPSQQTQIHPPPPYQKHERLRVPPAVEAAARRERIARLSKILQRVVNEKPTQTSNFTTPPSPPPCRQCKNVLLLSQCCRHDDRLGQHPQRSPQQQQARQLQVHAEQHQRPPKRRHTPPPVDRPRRLQPSLRPLNVLWVRWGDRLT